MIQAEAESRGEHAGFPIPVEGYKLIVEPRHPMYAALHDRDVLGDMGPAAPEETYQGPTSDGDDRKLGTEGVKAMIRWKMWINTLGVAASPAWSIQAELRAMDKLRAMVTPHAFKCYVLSGTFLETSRRSKMIYLFRKLRPTIAMRYTTGGYLMPAAVLCLHPIAYYDQSWAGAMVPTDDVVAHLTLMRGDEHKFWCKSNQHDIRRAEAGL